MKLPHGRLEELEHQMKVVPSVLVLLQICVLLMFWGLVWLAVSS